MVIRKDIEENIDVYHEEYADVPENILDKLEWFKDQKLGVIFHWGLYAKAGIVESWQLSKEDSWARKKPWRSDLETLRRDYWDLAKEFNPDKFDADKLAKFIKKSGFKYSIFTTKHHDGFNMFDTKESDYSITKYANKDLFKEYAQAFHDNDISVGAYYSKPDWHSEYYWLPGSDPVGRYASYNPKDYPEIWEKYNSFVKKQLIEIVSNYGDIDILWLDGGWVNTQNNEFLDMDDIVSSLRKIQPNLLVVDRTVGGKYENYVTPERKIPETPPVKAWESNIPLAKNWGYVPNDIYKPFDEILDSFLKIVSLGGNVIFGVAIKPDGTLPQPAQDILNQLGSWLNLYGQGIYGSRPILDLNISGWYFTSKDNRVYGFCKNGESDLEDLKQKNLPYEVKNIVELTKEDSPLFKVYQFEIV